MHKNKIWLLFLISILVIINYFFYVHVENKLRTLPLWWKFIPVFILVVVFIYFFYSGSSIEKFPEAVLCPRCKNLTDQNPCSHCGFDLLNSEDIKEKKTKNKWILFFLLLALFVIGFLLFKLFVD